MSEERKPLWPWIAALLIGLPVLYVASFGPACWLLDREAIPLDATAMFYRPLIRWTPRLAYDWLFRYSGLLDESGEPPRIRPIFYFDIVGELQARQREKL